MAVRDKRHERQSSGSQEGRMRDVWAREGERSREKALRPKECEQSERRIYGYGGLGDAEHQKA